jgi:hypothetical protein
MNKVVLQSIENKAASNEQAKKIKNEKIEKQKVENEGYASRNIDVKMNREQAFAFRSIQRMLEDRDMHLKDGSPVNNKRRTVLWLIENFAPV